MSDPLPSAPTITLVIATYNCAALLQRCLDSVASQDYPHLDVVVMDGASKDGTVDVIRANEERITLWRSEPDTGIYNAWNKAIATVESEWVCFLGADDVYSRPDAVSLLAAKATEDTDLVFGKARFVGANGRVRYERGEPWDWGKMKRAQNVMHPGALHRRRLFEQLGGYDERYRIAADYEFLLRAGAAGAKAAFVDELVVDFAVAGVSSAQLATYRENRVVHSRHPEIGPAKAWLTWASIVPRALAGSTYDRIRYR